MFDNFYESLLNQISLLRITDIIDILIVSFIIYKALKFIRDTRTIQLLKGIVVLIIVMQVSYFANMHTVHYILSNAMQLGLIAILIVFQPELRRALEQVGRTSMGQWFNFDEQTDDVEKEKVIFTGKQHGFRCQVPAGPQREPWNILKKKAHVVMNGRIRRFLIMTEMPCRHWKLSEIISLSICGFA